MEFGIDEYHVEVKRKKEVSDFNAYLLTFSIIALTAFEYFFRASYLFIPLFFYSLILFLIAKKKILKKFLFLIIPLLIINILQCYKFGVSYLTLLGLLQKFFIYYAIASLLGDRFFAIYVRIIYIFCIISLVFYAVQFDEQLKNAIVNAISPYTNALNKEVTEFNRGTNIIVHNFMIQNNGQNRNSGPFWEPGMFSLFINLSFVFNYLIGKRFVCKKNIIFAITNMTTFSTSGIIAMALIILGILLIEAKSKYRYLYIPLFLIFSFYIARMDFIQKKIKFQYETATFDDVNRFGAFLVHLRIISDNPILGVGVGANEDFFQKYTSAHALANGMSNVFVIYGIPFGLIYFLLLFIVCRKIVLHYIDNNFFAIILFISICILSFSQDITTRPLFYLLIVLGLFFIKVNTETEYLLTKDHNYAI